MNELQQGKKIKKKLTVQINYVQCLNFIWITVQINTQ